MNILLTERGAITAGEILAISRLGLSRKNAIEQAISSRGTRTLLARTDEGVDGAVAWSRLPWDSEIFGIAAGRLEFLMAAEAHAGALDLLCAAAVDDARSLDVRHLTARMPLGDWAVVQALERGGFATIDALQTLRLPLPMSSPAGRYLEGLHASLLRPFQSSDLIALCDLASQAHQLDRFHGDSSLPSGAADRVYAAWIRNCCLGQAGDCVLVALHRDRLAGYIACRLNSSPDFGTTGTILVMATVQRARGRGLGRAMIGGALDWFRQQGASSVDVDVPIRNIPAMRLFTSAGFGAAAASLTLRAAL